MIKENNLVGIVVWYYPTLENVGNINSYIANVFKLIVIDNSDNDNSNLLTGFDNSKIIYIANKKNTGIAAALNQGCKIGIDNGAEWVLTMDQDSSFLENNLETYINTANKYNNFDKVAIFAAIHFDSRNNNQKPAFEKVYSEITYTMTSGNLLSVKCLQKTGYFLESLFIDWVDEEICLRICKMNLLIVQLNNIFLEHYVGNGSKKINFFGYTKFIDNYSPIRYYYITRNVFIVSKLYPSDAKRLKKRWKRLVRKTVFYDNASKWLKIKYVIRGIFDYFINSTGSYKKNIFM